MLSLGLVAACVCALAVVVVVRGSPPREAVGRGVLEGLVVGVPMAAGLYGVASRGGMRFGAILLGTGFAWSLTALAETHDSLPYSIGRVAAWLVFPWLIYLMLAFPDGRVRPGFDRLLLRAFNGVLALLFILSALFVTQYPELTPWTSCRHACPPNAFLVLRSEPAVMHDVVQPVRELLAVLLFGGVAVSMVRRWRAATPLRRPTVGPVTFAGVASVVLLVLFFAARALDAADDTVEALGVLWALCIPALGAAFFAGLLRRELLVGQVLVRLGGMATEAVDAPAMRDAVAGALADPTLEILTPAGPALWQDRHGRRIADLASAAEGRTVTLVRDAGAPALVLLHDPDLAADEQLLRAVGSLVVAGLRHNQLESRLASSLDQLASSRRRIATAADLERARIERDLHDGAQQRLIALRLRLSLAEETLRTDPDAAAAAVAGLGDEVERTLDELRSLAHGVYPSMLRDRGLVEALRGFAAHAPMPVHVQAFGVTRHSTAVDTAVYFTCVEAVQNAVKHAPTATGVWIVLRESEMLTVDVRDDGPGFLPPEADAGARALAGGLRNMHDRIEAVGGRLTIESSPGEGTHIMAFVPLGDRS